MSKKAKSKLPKTGTFFFSESNYFEFAGVAPEMVYLYSVKLGVWYVNGDWCDPLDVPDDLWPVRPVQRG